MQTNDSQSFAARLQTKQLHNETRNPGVLIKKQNCFVNFMKQLLRDTQFFVGRPYSCLCTLSLENNFVLDRDNLKC